ncbi:mandelate racemase/muconate lactonizing enzyme family protein [Paraburkholderia sp. Ac-20336]|uniref:mandelate racemase/muconate lactonizing enzyme family protein n=1 Tax=Burkholderiaceae TaxID=119060 RepID=UPI00141FA137|nr:MULTISPECIES: mandelate racemase/muconate lactonizing enzyme family protein [Burkholderiaceae]MBN3801893.1 mandelate racemase/muconate lactonizing enzyme family protein [Paraburkholderia sp. Ac-20336]NIF55469.1 mandelate racemase/muconate lactonizing enzyme family protein [Burkholderia sp. Ax-1724]
MKITQVDIYLARSGKLHPIIVEVSTDEGINGIGEAGVAYGRGAHAAAGMLKDLAPDLIGRDPARIEAFSTHVYDHTFWAKGGGTIVFAALSALEQALWDIKGRACGLPVYQLLGGAVNDRIRCYANGWYEAAQTPDEFARATERPLADGYTALKFYPLGQMLGVNMRHVSQRSITREQADLAVARVKAVREAIGPDVDLMLDLSGGLSAAEAARLCNRFEPYDIQFVEEPTDPSDADAMAWVAARTSIPLAAGERNYGRHQMRALIETRAVDIVQPDPCNTGGIMETKKIAAMAEAFGMRVAPHVCGSPLATQVARHLAINLPNISMLELYPYFRFHDGYIDTVRDAPEASVKEGYLSPPEGPGLGAELNRDALAPFLCERIGGPSR